MKCNTFVFGKLCIGLVGNSAQLPSLLEESLQVVDLLSTNIDDKKGHTIYM